MTKPDFDVGHLAELARMNLTDEEKVRFGRELEKVLAYVDQLQRVETEGVEETAQVTGLTNVFQDIGKEEVRIPNDELMRRREELLAAAPQTKDGFVKIPAIFESNDE